MDGYEKYIKKRFFEKGVNESALPYYKVVESLEDVVFMFSEKREDMHEGGEEFYYMPLNKLYKAILMTLDDKQEFIENVSFYDLKVFLVHLGYELFIKNGEDYVSDVTLCRYTED